MYGSIPKSCCILRTQGDRYSEIMAVVKYVEDIAGYTTMHGFSRIFESKATPKRIAWILVFMTAWAFFTWQVSSVFISYFQYPKTLTTNIVLGGVPFPAITLCNLGSFDFYTVYRLSKELQPFKDSSPKNQENISVYLNDTFIRAMFKYYRVLGGNSSLKTDEWKLYYDKMFSRTTLAANIPTRILSANGYQEDEFIVKCTYRNKPCKFEKIFDPYFFNCYTFTAPNITTDDETTMLLEGIDNGLTVMLLAGTRMLKEVENPDFSGMPGIYSKDSALSGAAGVRVVIHSPGTKPFPLTEGYDIPPDVMAALSLAPKKRKRLGQPHGNCMDKYSFLNQEEQKLVGPYRKTACEKVCIQKQIYKECNCYENTLPTELDLLPNDDGMNSTRKTNSTTLQDYCFTEKYLGGEWNSSKEDPCKEIEKCSGTNEFHKCFKFYSSELPTCKDEVLRRLFDKIKCADEVKDRVMANATLLYECGCHPPCKEVLYDVAYSLSQWPSQGIEGDTVYYEIMNEQGYMDKFAYDGKKEFYENYTKKDIRRALKDFSKINVYVSDASVFLTKEEPAMTRTQLISDIGGQLGVWIGVSVLTIAEVLEILILILMDICRKRPKGEKPKDVEAQLNSLATEDNIV